MGQKLGQHFLTSSDIAAKIARVETISIGETVLEVGPGKGILTEQLLAAGGKVIAVEKDSTLVVELEEKFKKEILKKDLKIVEGDILKQSPESLEISKYKIIANIPYYLTGKFLRQWLSTNVQPSSMALLVQREVAERIVAKDSRQSVLSISVKCYGTPSMKGIVKAGSFSPPPKVDSAILSIENISRVFFEKVDEDWFFSVLKAGFAHPRKLLTGNLRMIATTEDILAVFGAVPLEIKVRAENLSLDDWQALARGLAPIHISPKE